MKNTHKIARTAVLPIVGIYIAAAFSQLRAPAQSQFYFSIVDNPYLGGTSPGTASGILTLNSSNTAANSLFITFDSIASYNPQSSYSFDYVSEGFVTTNVFAVSSGQITYACFAAYHEGVDSVGFNGAFGVNGYFAQGEIENRDGMAGITFTPVPPPAVPAIGLTCESFQVLPTFSNLTVGTNYQLQVCTSLTGTFTNYGSTFIATNGCMVYPRYLDANQSQLFFRVKTAP